MQKIWQRLSEIRGLLEQIHSITQNQTTVLLESAGGEECINILEQMFEYKSSLIDELEKIEARFQENYKEIRAKLEEDRELIRLKDEVASVLKVKEQIVQREQQNTLLMTRQREHLIEKVEVKCSPQVVIASYKKYSKK